MDFNELVLQKIMPLLTENGFNNIEVYEGFLKFASPFFEAVLSHDKLSKECAFYIGTKDGFLYPVIDGSIKNVFELDIQLEQKPEEIFIDNVVLFLQEAKDALFNSNSIKLNEFIRFVETESKKYTSGMMESQILAAAGKAWEKRNYAAFINLLNQLDKTKLLASYQLKYKYAVKHA